MRSKCIHEGRVSEAQLWRSILMDLWAMLPDNKPDYQGEIKINGKNLFLQSVNGSTARYVSNIAYKLSEYEYAPTDKRTRIIMELHILNVASYEIAELEAKGANPINEIDEAEIA